MKKSAWLFLSVSAMAACQSKTDAAPQTSTESVATPTAAASAANGYAANLGNNVAAPTAAADPAQMPTTTTPNAPAKPAQARAALRPADDQPYANDQRAKAGANGKPSPEPTPPVGMADGLGVGLDNTRTLNHAGGGAARTQVAAIPPPPPGFRGGPTGATQGTGAPVDMPVEPAAPVPVVDRNARYATTYRPGGAALAAFDAAVTKGSIPTTYKDLVGDFGGRYAPSLSVPAGSAMAFSIEGDRAMLSPSGGLMNLRISMRSSDAMPTRAPLSVHLVLDISGSMQGLAIENAKQAAETLVNKLEPQDDFSMVIFSDEAQVLVDDGPAVPRKPRIIDAIHKIQAEGGTNISSGLDMGYKLAHTQSINPDAVKIVMFLSDGHANAGDVDPVHIAQRSARAFQDGIQTSSFGLGADFDAQIMSSVADQGAGGYYYLADSAQISPALTRELDARLVPVAQAVEVRLRLRPEVIPRKVFGSHVLDKQEAALVRAQEVVVDTQVAKRDNIKRDRQMDAEGGMRFFMPSFARDDRHAMLVTLEVPEGVGEASIGSVEIKYKDRLAKKNVTQEIAIHAKYATSDAESAATTNQSVAATVQAFAAGDAILKAADSIDRGNRPYAAQVLQERAELLKRASSMLEEPRLGEEALRLSRLSSAVNGDQKIGDPLPLALMLRGSGYGYLR